MQELRNERSQMSRFLLKSSPSFQKGRIVKKFRQLPYFWGWHKTILINWNPALQTKVTLFVVFLSWILRIGTEYKDLLS